MRTPHRERQKVDSQVDRQRMGARERNRERDGDRERKPDPERGRGGRERRML